MKKSKLIGIIIGIILIGAAAFIGYNLLKPTDNKSDENNDSATTETDKTSKELTSEEREEITNVINKLDVIDLYHHNISEDNKLSNEEILWFGFKMLNKTIDENITLKEMQNVISKYLGSSFKEEDIYMYINNCSVNKVPYFIYDANTKTYSYNEKENVTFACSNFTMEVLNRIDSISKDGDTYTVVTYKAYSKDDDFFGPSAYYGKIINNNRIISFDNKLFAVEYDPNEDGEVLTDVDKEFASISNDKLTKVTYTFVKDTDDNYMLKSYILE